MLLTRFLRDERGEIAIGYGLLASLAAFIFVSGLRLMEPPRPEIRVDKS